MMAFRSRKTSEQRGGNGRASSEYLPSSFGSARHGRRGSWAFLRCARSTPTHGQGASGHTGSSRPSGHGAQQDFVAKAPIADQGTVQLSATFGLLRRSRMIEMMAAFRSLHRRGRAGSAPRTALSKCCKFVDER